MTDLPSTPVPSAFEDDPATAFIDPHVSKIPADDPRLQLARATGRTLRKGPAIAIATGLLTALTAAGAVALQPAAPPPAPKSDTDPAASVQSPVLPESLRGDPAPRSAPRAAQATVATPSPEGGPRANPSTPPPVAGPAPADRERELRAEEEEKSLHAGILFDTHAGGGAPMDLPGAGFGAPAAATASSGPSRPSQADDDPNRQQRKNDFLGSDQAGDSMGSTLQHPSSPYEVMAGTVIPAVLLTAVNSDIPGPVLAQVRENVYDTVTGNTLLVPQGARLVANYDSMVSWGQTRIGVCWRRLLFPNGDSVNLHCAPAADLRGAAGLADQVDEHWWRLIAGAAISSLLAATATAAAGNQTTYAPSVPQLLATNAAGNVNQTGQQIVRRDLQVQPTITVRPGFSVNVFVHKDLTLPPYRDTGTLAWGDEAPLGAP